MKGLEKLTSIRLAEVLTQKAVVPNEAITDALYAQDRRGGSFVELIVSGGDISEWDIAKIVVEAFQVPFVMASNYEVSEEVKNALSYVIQNACHHAQQAGRLLAKHYLDPFSSWAYFDGWRENRKRLQTAAQTGPPPVAKPHTWMLQRGWRQHGLLTTC